MSILDSLYSNKQGNIKAGEGGGGMMAGDPNLEYTSILGVDGEGEGDYR